MRFLRGNLAPIVKQIAKITPRRSSRNQGSDIAFFKSAGGYLLEGGSNECMLRHFVGTEDSEGPDSFYTNAKRLSYRLTAFINQPDAEIVSFEEDAKTGLIYLHRPCRDARFALEVVRLGSRPINLNRDSSTRQIILPTKSLAELAWVAKAMCVDGTRPQIRCMHFGDGHLEATDGHRMHRSSLDYAGADSVLIEAGVIRQVFNMLGEARKQEELVLEQHRGRYIDVIQLGGWSLYYQGVGHGEDGFPAIDQVIPMDVWPVFTMATSELKQSVELLQSALRMNKNEIEVEVREGRVYFHDYDRLHRLRMDSAEIHDRAPRRFALNARFLVEAVHGQATFTLKMAPAIAMADATNPMLVGHEARTSVIMPMRASYVSPL